MIRYMLLFYHMMLHPVKPEVMHLLLMLWQSAGFTSLACDLLNNRGVDNLVSWKLYRQKGCRALNREVRRKQPLGTT